MAFSTQSSASLGSLSLTPLIDVVFLLLIFFLVATRFEQEERHLEITLPQASEAKPLTVRPQELVVNVTRDGAVSIGTKSLDQNELYTVLQQAWMRNPGRQRVIIRADEETQTRHVVTVMNACNQARIRDYVIATE